MPFEKNHQKGAKKIIGRPLDKEPIAFKGFEGTKERLKSIPGWQDKFREFTEKLIDESDQN